jgi:predicted MPP superfamily phosphohydrolase
VSAGPEQQPDVAVPHAEAAAVRPTGTQRLARRVLPLVVASTVYFAFMVYPPLRILGLALPHWQPATPELLVIMAGPLLVRIACEYIKGALSRVLSAMVMTWLGICFMAFGLVVVWELVNIAFDLPARASGLTLAGIVGALAAYGWWNAHRLVVREVQVTVPADAPEAARGKRFVQISDVHVGSRSGRFLRRVVERANQVDADYVLITGDLIDFRNIGEDELASLATLRHPAYFCIGNHERYVDLEAICQRLRNLGVQVLRNESLQVGPFQILGIDDAEPKTQVASQLRGLQAVPDAYRVLLYHRPDGTRDAADWGAHLMLCGHTHNGQIVPFNYLVRRVFPKICGLYLIGNMQLYVSPGTGTWGPILRLGSRCEIGVIHLQ